MVVISYSIPWDSVYIPAYKSRMPLPDPQSIIERLTAFQAEVRQLLMQSRQTQSALHAVNRDTAADTIYAIDTVVEPILDAFCEEWSRTTPLVLIAEGVEDENGNEGKKVYPIGIREEDAAIRLLIDPIDGTRAIMYDKRSAWALAGVAPNKGLQTRLRDIEVSVMTELPTSKAGFADVLWATKGGGTHGKRVDLRTGDFVPLNPQPSAAHDIQHGFASVANFFPATKRIAAELMERIAAALCGNADPSKATVFDDQYISTGGQFYELIVGHDRFIADLRPIFYRMLGMPEGLCCHPYDCATWLIAEEAGVVLTDGFGNPLDGPMDVTSGISWAGYANRALAEKIEPVIREFVGRSGR